MITLPKGYRADMARLAKYVPDAHLKIELEADLSRPDYDSTEYCRECNEGWLNCPEACDDGELHDGPEPDMYLFTFTDGTTATGNFWSFGNFDSRERSPEWLDWDANTTDCDCESGSIRCNNCDGEGVVTYSGGDWSDEYECHQFIIDQLDTETREAISYSKFYNDGSVDSELTFTMPVAKAHLAVNVIRAFNALAEAIGNGMDLTNSGMHLSVFSGPRYPRCPTLNTRGMVNFQTEVTKLLPALFAAATHNGTTRGLYFRYPRVSVDDKYSAIFTHYNTAIEFRLFDVCYDQPEALLEKFRIIARVMRYYGDPTAKVRVKSPAFWLNLPSNSREQCQFADTIQDLDNYRALAETVRAIRPHGTTIAQFMSRRGLDKFDATKAKLEAKRRLAEQLAELRRNYKFDNMRQKGRYYYELGDWLRTYAYQFDSQEAAIAHFDVSHTSLKPLTLRQYLKNNLTSGRKQGIMLALTD